MGRGILPFFCSLKILAYTQLWKRPELTRLVFKQINRIGDPFVTPFAVLSEDYMKGICEDEGVKWVYAPNEPLSDKHNIGLQATLSLDWDYCLSFGSDDLISHRIFEVYGDVIKEGVDFAGLNDMWFYHKGSLKTHTYKQKNASYGAGRLISRRLAEKLNGNVWAKNGRITRIDTDSRDIIQRAGFKHTVIRTDLPVVVDVKTEINLWPYDHWKGQEVSLKELEKTFDNPILEQLKSC